MERQNEPIGPQQEPGTSEVHSALSVNPSKGEGMSGRFDTEQAGTIDRTRERIEETRSEITGRASGIRDRVAEAQTNLRDRATEMRGRARARVDDARADAERVADEVQGRARQAMTDSGATRKIEQYPLVALGVAFGAGFLLAGSGNDRNGRVSRAKHQIRGALMTAATAALAREARAMLGLESGQGGLSDVLGGSRGSRAESESARQSRGTSTA